MSRFVSSHAYRASLGLLTATLMLLGPGAVESQTTVLLRPVAEATILALDAVPGDQEFAFPLLTVPVHGHVLPVVLNFTSTGSGISRQVAQYLGFPTTGTFLLDSLTLGTAIVHAVSLDIMRGSTAGGAGRGVIGADVFLHYDVLVDGPAHLVRLYAQPTLPHAARLPAGLTPQDCLPMLSNPRDGGDVCLDLPINGHVIHTRLESGALWTSLNPAAVRVLGLVASNPHVRPFTGDAEWGSDHGPNNRAIWEATDAPIPFGAQQLTPPIQIYDGLPWQTSPDDGRRDGSGSGGGA
jgi:hypothetical protein